MAVPNHFSLFTFHSLSLATSCSFVRLVVQLALLQDSYLEGRVLGRGWPRGLPLILRFSPGWLTPAGISPALRRGTLILVTPAPGRGLALAFPRNQIGEFSYGHLLSEKPSLGKEIILRIFRVFRILSRPSGSFSRRFVHFVVQTLCSTRKFGTHSPTDPPIIVLKVQWYNRSDFAGAQGQDR